MEREKEIIKASVDYNADKGKLRVIGGDAILSDEEFIAINQNISFIDGVKWADKHPRKGLVDIEKVCEWLVGNISKYVSAIKGADVIAVDCKLFDDFRKFMEEEK